MATTLVLLAAGIGSRYGSPKQLERFGGGRHILLEYAIFECYRRGIRRAVCVVRRQDREILPKILERARKHMAIEFCVQNPADLPAGARTDRSGPLGTAHALFSARHLLEGPFLTANGDDFYGPAAWRDLADAVRAAPNSSTLLAYRLAATLSPNGPVSRGICAVKDSKLLTINEVRGIRFENGEILSSRPDLALGAQTPTAMNLFYLQRNFLPLLEADGEEFFAAGGLANGEWGLPQALSRAVARNSFPVNVRQTDSPWCGVTHPTDRDAVSAAICAAGDGYPENFFP
ncbi:MAG: NTP transferase domain-containing protein [Puniceicoccales bacterium]|jgi:hypothetical protein|nr:NTP transferase domain-containing protein [Puniceicoccales bacterium]